MSNTQIEADQAPTIKDEAITQFPSPVLQEEISRYSNEEKIHKIRNHIQAIMEILGLDLRNPSLQKTPDRVASMYVNEIFSGLDPEAFPDMTLFDDEDLFSVGNHIIVTQSSLTSFCEHHLVPMVGTAYIGYLPHSYIIGLSKISRLVRYFACRPQIQERLSAQIGDSLATILGHEDVIVYIQATHMCVLARGAKDEQAETTTLYTSGVFEGFSEHRKEFLEIIQTMGTQNDKKFSSFFE